MKTARMSGRKPNRKKYPNCYDGHQYALDIVDEKIPSCSYVYAACERYLEDIERPEFELKWKLAEKFMRLFQKFHHVIGEWETPNIILSPWQKFFYLNVELFYWKKTGKRRYKTAHLEVARGNGKSAMSSVTGLIYLNLIEVVAGNKVYACATKRDQARIVLDSARAMAKKNKSYLKNTGAKVYMHKITHEKSESEFVALSSDHDSLDGLQPVLAIVDELHAHKNRKLYDVVDSAMSKRKDSFLQVITTAGDSTAGIGYSQSQYAKKVALGEVDDDTFMSLVYTLDEDDDWKDPKVWIKANPNWGVSVDPEAFTAKARKAMANPSDEANFKIKHLDLWQNTLTQFFSVKKWDALGDTSLKLEDFKGMKCYTGVDLASKIDIASIGYVFKNKKTGKFTIFDQSFCPEETIEESKNNLYTEWVESGALIKTPGASHNIENIRNAYVKEANNLKVAATHYDPWNATEFAQQLEKKRIDATEFRMSVANLSEPMKKLEALIRDGLIEHNGSPLLSWCLGNVVAKRDHNDNVFPRKDHDSLKIDPIVSIIMAIAGWVDEEENESVYETRGIRVL